MCARSKDGEVVGRRGAAILGLENGEPRRLRTDGHRAGREDQPREHDSTTQRLSSCFRAFVATHGWTLRCRVISEYSSICAVRSTGYEMVTSVMSPASFVTASSFGITNAA